MTTAWVPLATTTLSSSATSVTFGSIPQGYRDLAIVINGVNSASQDLKFIFNGDTGANYSRVFMYGQSSGYGSASENGQNAGLWASVQAVGNTVIANIMDYSSTNVHKSAIVRSDNAGDRVRAYFGRWASTSAITSIQLDPNSSSWQSGTVLSLYGSNRL
jgi:hypothetical protein